MDHSGMGHGGMDHGGMDHGAMGQGGMSREATEGDSHGMAAHGQGKGPMVPMMCRTAEHVDGRLAYLKAELKPTDAQTPQWNAFAEAIRVSGRKVAEFCAASKEERARPAEGEKAASHGLLEQLAHMERNMTIHLESVRAVRSAAEPLAAALTPEQKKIFDETMTGLMGFGMGMGKM
ncbi:hypothetical protein MSC49_04080 [Methylosinus sp. C49]|nr:hypothetical protein MSC49_04080 [Methylosinus sp. C49]